MPATFRRGLSLLEVMLALAIFGTSLALLGELLRIGARSAADARDLTDAQLHCESLMAEITAGVRTADPVAEPTQIEIDPQWLYSVQVEPATQTGLIAVTVKVERNASQGRRASFSLIRWIPDPALDLSSTQSDPTSAAAAPAGGASG